MEANWFEAKVKLTRLDEYGREKKVVETYLVDAVSYTEAEARMVEEMDVIASGDFHITGLKPSRISEVLEKVGLPDKQEKFPHQLSGGEQQRVVLARALLNAPPIILADEPTGNIDPETSFRLLELLKDICDGGKTILIATHQYELIKHFPGRVFRCEDGAVKEDFSFLPQEEEAVSTSGEELESPEGEPSSETLEPNSAAEVPPMASPEREEASHAPTLETPSEEKPVPEPSEEKSADETLAETAQASSPDDNENNKEKQKEKKDDKSPDDLLEFELI